MTATSTSNPSLTTLSDSTLLLRTAIAQGDMTALLTDLGNQLHQQAAVLTKLPSSAEVSKAKQSLLKMQSLMPRFQTSVDALAHERQALHALYEVGQSVNSTLELEQLQPRPTDRILEIGTGSGYQAAVLAELAGRVYSIEIVQELAQRAAADLARLGYTNDQVRAGDGYKGWPEAAPLDSIIVTCAPEKVPDQLIEQLKDGGRIIVPTGPAGDQELVLLTKSRGKIERTALLPVRFVPMIRSGR